MTSQTKAEKAKNRGLCAAQNNAQFFHIFFSESSYVAKNSQPRSNMPYSYFSSLKSIFFKICVSCILKP